MNPPTLDRRGFKAFLMTVITTVLADANEELKGTHWYSSKLKQVLDNYLSTKIRAVYKGNPTVAEQGYMSGRMVEKAVYAAVVIDTQPEHVKQRFNREFEALLIRYGVNVQEMENI